MSASPSSAGSASLASLRGLRTAPVLGAEQRGALLEELRQRLGHCSWFTIGVMAQNRQAALDCLRNLETALGWSPLQEESEPDPTGADASNPGPVFLKGNQRSGGFRIRREDGLGEGLLITGHNPDAPAAEDTWGPLPLDLFA